MTGAMMGVATMTMMAARLQVDRDREFVRLGLMMLTALAVAVEMVMRWWLRHDGRFAHPGRNDEAMAAADAV
jgi:hypothetical protein